MNCIILTIFCQGNIFAEPPSVYPQQGVLSFLGLDNKSSPTAVSDGRASDLLNVKFDATGGLIKRPGFSAVGTPLDIADRDYSAIQGIYYTKYSTGTEDTLVACDGRFYRFDADLTPDDWTDINKGQVGTGGKNTQFIFTTALDTIIATNDTEAPFKCTEGGTVTFLDVSGLTDSLDSAKTVVWYKNYLIFGNTVEADTSRSTRFRWSNVGTIETWSDDDYIDISTLGGQEIEGFGILYDNLYMFLTESIYQISLVGGDEIFKVTKVVEGIGTIAKNSIQHIILQNSQQGLVFLTKDKKVYFFNGINAQYISILIEGTTDDLNAARLKYAVSSENGTDYYLAVANGSSSENDLLLDFQFQIGEWSKFDQIDANALARVFDVNGLEQTYVGQYAGMVVKMDDTTKDNDIDGYIGTVSGPGVAADILIDVYNTTTASGLQIVYDNTTTFTTSGLIGGIMKITGGSGSGEERRIVWNTSSGIVVETAFSTDPDTTSSYSIGAIDGYFTSKWYDCGSSVRVKSFGELYWWAEVETSADIDVTYATDFSGDIETQAVSLAGEGTDAIWGSAIWGTGLWGGTEAIFRQTKLQNEGRYLKWKFQNDDIDETFKIYSTNIIFWGMDIN